MFEQQRSLSGPVPGHFPRQTRILIVEDERLIGMFLKDSLEEAGAHVVWAETDAAAYRALDTADRPFDVLVLDIDLGHGTTGFDIARHARVQAPDVGIIFSSGSPPDWLQAFGVPDALFVPKPCTEAAMLATITLLTEDRVPAE